MSHRNEGRTHMSSDKRDAPDVADKAEDILERIVKAKGGKRRDGQVLMARVCAESLRHQTPLLLEGSTGIGKALSVDTLIPTPHGFKRLGSLRIGDEVYSEEGRAVKITAAFEVMFDRPCYRVTFSDGSTIVADAEHGWNTLTALMRRRAGRDTDAPHDPWLYTRTTTTTDMLATLNAATGANHQIPLAQPLRIDDGAVTPPPIDPYILGVWLFAPRNRDEQLRLSALQGRDVPGYEPIEPGSSLFEPTRATLDTLRGIGLLDAKRIPDDFLFRPETDRRRLLAGIVDVRGDVTTPPRSRGQVRITHPEQRLLDSARSLLASLGIRGSCAGSSFTSRVKAKTSPYVTYSPEWDPFVLAASKKTKLDLPEPVTLAWRTKRRSVVSIEPVESVPVRCITVDSPRHLYLAGTSMIPTHNSIGYLAAGLAHGGPVVVAPHTKALMDQLVTDLEILASAYDADDPGSPIAKAPTHTLIKGRSSYVCLNKLKGAAGQGEQEELDLAGDPAQVAQAEPTSEVGAQVRMIHEWADGTLSGDRSDLPEPVSSKVWSTVSVTSDGCIGSKCAFAQDCFANKAREKAADVDFIITNHKFLSMAMKYPDLLPENVSAVIVDESHELPSTISETFGAQLSAARLDGVLKAAKPLGDASKAGANLLKDGVKYVVKMDELPEPKGDDREHPVSPAVVEYLEGLRALIAQLAERVEYMSVRTEEEKSAADALKRSLSNVTADIAILLDGHTDTQVVWSALEGDNKSLVLHAAQFDSSETIFNLLLKRFRSVIFTSATLTIANSFELAAKENGFGREGSPYRWQVVPSPFDYPKQGRVFCPPDMPDPANRSPEGVQAYFDAVGAVAVRAAKAADGRMLMLCSSRSSVERVSAYLREHLPERNKVLVQGSDSSPKHLAQEFAADPHSVLVGTRSFWTGISVEGDTCAVTVIDKIPFPPPTDPIIAARSEKADRENGEWSGFNEVSVPEATRTIVQGAGREIRTINDRGVVILCDPRVAPRGRLRKRYASTIQRSLPPFTLARTWGEVEEFLAHINATANDDVVVSPVVEDDAVEEDDTAAEF